MIRRKLELLSTLPYRHDSVCTRLRSHTGRPCKFYYYVPENIPNPYIKRGWHWVENEEELQVALTLLRQKNIEDAALLKEHVAALTYTELKGEEVSLVATTEPLRCLRTCAVDSDRPHEPSPVAAGAQVLPCSDGCNEFVEL